MICLARDVTQCNDWSPFRQRELKLELWLTSGYSSVVDEEFTPVIFDSRISIKLVDAILHDVKNFALKKLYCYCSNAAP